MPPNASSTQPLDASRSASPRAMSQPAPVRHARGHGRLRRADPEAVQTTEAVEHEPGVPVGGHRHGACDVPAGPVRGARRRRRRGGRRTGHVHHRRLRPRPARAGRRARAGHGRIGACPMVTRGDAPTTVRSARIARHVAGHPTHRRHRGAAGSPSYRRARAPRGHPGLAARAPALDGLGAPGVLGARGRRSGCAAWPRAFADGIEFQFVARAVDSGEVLGTIGLNAMDRLNRWANLGYWLRSDRVGEGLVTRAATLVTGSGSPSSGSVASRSWPRSTTAGVRPSPSGSAPCAKACCAGGCASATTSRTRWSSRSIP